MDEKIRKKVLELQVLKYCGIPHNGSSSPTMFNWKKNMFDAYSRFGLNRIQGFTGLELSVGTRKQKKRPHPSNFSNEKNKTKTFSMFGNQKK